MITIGIPKEGTVGACETSVAREDDYIDLAIDLFVNVEFDDVVA